MPVPEELTEELPVGSADPPPFKLSRKFTNAVVPGSVTNRYPAADSVVPLITC